jgi:hypothetical protein
VSEQPRQCSTCRFWEAVRQVCRRSPPLAIPVYVLGVGQGVWPRTAPGDWCGAHAFKSSGPKAEGA